MQGGNRRLAILITIFLCLVVYFVSTYRMGVVRGESMQPTYMDGTSVLVRRLNRLGRPLKRGDVVLVRNDHEVIIKRVYRIAGEEIDHSFPDVLAASVRNDLTDYYDQKRVERPEGPTEHYYVPKGYIVVIGDNIERSEDSRVFGPVALKDVLGAVVNPHPAPYSQNGRGGPDSLRGSGQDRFYPQNRDLRDKLSPDGR
jgi:signal peptidase I